MDEVIERAELLFDELNITKVRFAAGGADPENARADFEDLLLDAYTEGYAAAAYILGEEIDMDAADMEAVLHKEYNGVSIEWKFDHYYARGDEEKLSRLIDSEYHRAYNAGSYDAARKSGKTLYKTWNAVLDDRTRETHDILNATKIPFDERFYSVSGDSALYPGGFETAEENSNCRCLLEYSVE